MGAIFTFMGLSTIKSVHWWLGQYAMSSMDLSAALRSAQVGSLLGSNSKIRKIPR